MGRVDNSEYARNGDYQASSGSSLSRLDAQRECVQSLLAARRKSNVENSCALMCQRPTPTLLVSLSSSSAPGADGSRDLYLGRFGHALASLSVAASPCGGETGSSGKCSVLASCLRMASVCASLIAR